MEYVWIELALSILNFLRIPPPFITQIINNPPQFLVKKQFNLKNVEISFDEAFNILDFWFKSSSNIKLANQRELLPIGEPVRKMLEDTIDKYQKMLADTTADIEK